MASVRDTVYHMLVAYPTLFKNKSDCFAHLFLTCGNGYDWKDGEIVSVIAEKNRPWQVPQFVDEVAEFLKMPEEIKFLADQRRLDIRRRNNQIKFVIENFDFLIDEPMSFRNLHAFSNFQYELLCCIPKDIKDDWRLAAKLTIYAVLGYCKQFNLGRFNADDARIEVNTVAQERLDNFIQREHECMKKFIDEMDKE